MNAIKNVFTLAFAVVGTAALIVSVTYERPEMYLMVAICGLLTIVSHKSKV